MDVWKQMRAILLLPVTVTVIVPGVLLYFTGWKTCKLWNRLPLMQFVLPVLGLLFVGIGLMLVVSTIRLFVTVGGGTLAPWDPTKRLVVQGIYRHVRNPMISGVFSILLGEAAGFASLPLTGWCVLFIAGNAMYIPFVEEPGLLARFGREYEEYRRNVPRWVPRMTPWQPDDE